MLSIGVAEAAILGEPVAAQALYETDGGCVFAGIELAFVDPEIVVAEDAVGISYMDPRVPVFELKVLDGLEDRTSFATTLDNLTHLTWEGT